MPLKRVLFYSQICLLLLNVANTTGKEFKIAYHVVCDGDYLVNLSYNLMNGESEVYPNYLEMEDNSHLDQDQEARLLKGICTNEDFKDQLMGYPLLPSLQHGYVVVGLGGNGQSPNSFNIENPVIL